MPPVSISIACAIETSASGNQFWVNLEKPPTREEAGKQEGVENEESGDDDEQPAHAVVAPDAGPTR